MFRSSTFLPAWTLLAALSMACSEDEMPLGPPAESPEPATAGVIEAKPVPVNGRIVYSALVDGDREIVSVNPDGTDLRRLTFSPGQDYLPAVSPDGRRIAFTSFRGGVTEIYVMNADGSRTRRLTRFGPVGFAEAPAWSPDGKRIAFSGAENSSDLPNSLYVIGANGRDLRRILSDPDLAANYDLPTWSPDGRKIAFTQNGFNIFTVNADGTGFEQFSGCGIHPCINPAWSPDGTRIAYEVAVSSGMGLIEVKTFGQPAQQLAVNIASGRGGPAWSPDGARLVYPATEDGVHARLFTVGADGTGAEAIGAVTTADQDPSWAPRSR